MYKNMELIQMKVPKFYKKDEYKSGVEKSVMYAVLNAFAKTLDDSMVTIDRLNAAIGIDTTYDEDLEYRWGNLLGIHKKEGESYDLYRNELKLAVPSLVGGTKEAIVHAIAIVIGIDKDNELQADYITVVDGWEYDGDADVPDKYRQYGSFICIIDLSVGEGAVNIEQKVIDSIDKIKASGVGYYIVYKAFKVSRYYQLDVFNYDTLGNTSYDYLGVE